MYICLCKAITDKDIAEAVNAGHVSFEEVQYQLDVSTGCGSCQQSVQAVISHTVSKNMSGQSAERLSAAKLIQLTYAA